MRPRKQELAKAVNQYCKDHNLHISGNFTIDRPAIYWLIEAKMIIDEAIRTNCSTFAEEGEPSWAMLWSNSDRIFEHVAGVITCYYTGCWSSVEVLTRIAIESSINLLYITSASGNRVTRLGEYLSDYFDYSKKSQEKAKSFLPERRLGEDEDRSSIDYFRNILEHRRTVIQAVCKAEGIPFGIPGWPANVFERFKQSGHEQEYRTIYSALSSEVHNDASSLVDYIITKSLLNQNETEEIAAVETLFWIRHYTYTALEWYVKSLESLTASLEMIDAQQALTSLKDDVTQQILSLSSEFRQHQQEAINHFTSRD